MNAAPLRIAIVEDEAVLAMQLEYLIEAAGHVVAGSAMSSTEVEALIDVGADLAMVDVHLADGPTGVDVARRLAGSGVAVVFLTANVKRIPRDYAGAIGAIGKPYTQSGFSAALAYIEALLASRDPGQLPAGLEVPPASPEVAPAAPGASSADTP